MENGHLLTFANRPRSVNCVERNPIPKIAFNSGLSLVAGFIWSAIRYEWLKCLALLFEIMEI